MESLEELLKKAMLSIDDACGNRIVKKEQLLLKEPTDNSSKDNNQTLNEELFDLNSQNDVEKAKEFLDSKVEAEPALKVVDPAITDEKDLKKNYLGNMILQCEACHTLFYKNPEELVKDETCVDDDKACYNKEDICPHCGAAGPFILVGQVAAANISEEKLPLHDDVQQEDDVADIDTEIPEVKGDAPEVDKAKSEEEEEDTEENKPVKPFKRSAKKESLDSTRNFVDVTDFDECSFDKVINEFITGSYDDLTSYKTARCYESDDCLLVEGVVTGGNKKKSIKFKFKPYLRDNKVYLSGLCEAFTAAKNAPFKVTCKISNNSLITESLRYNFTVDKDKKLFGTIINK